jgi:hypothetical protein
MSGREDILEREGGKLLRITCSCDLDIGLIPGEAETESALRGKEADD